MGYTVEETVWIAMADGTRLAARIWMPQGEGAFPAVLEFLPYRRRDGTSQRDESTYPAFAEAGIAGVRVDSRGNGDSQGVFDDEYSPQELSDASEVIAWIAQQPWSNGRVGMMGTSWGGFNALQAAALRPPALKAVISIASTADRFDDDIHYKGGCLLSANVSWAGTMLSYASRPPDPAVVGEGWRALWLERLRAEPFLLETWLAHQRRDAYWRHGSICEDWSAIACPVFVIAGWADGYRNTPAAIAANATTLVKAMTGPWVHKYPHFAWPEPRADFLGMAIAWWKRWLADEPTGVEDWPAYRAWLSEAPRPGGWRAEEPGRWVGLAQWPAPDATQCRLTLGVNGHLGGAAPGERVVTSPQHCGTTAGKYFTLKPDGELAADQGLDDAMSLVWESDALEAPLDILGRPELTLTVAINQPQGNLAARLVDVHPDGAASLISRGVLNLCHRAGSAEPVAMVPGDFEDVTLRLDETGYRLAEGHRLRLSLSTAYWPYILPSPAPVRARVLAGSEAELVLPLLAPGAADAPPPEPANPDPLPPYPVHLPGHSERQVERDLQSGRVRYVVSDDSGLVENPVHGMLKRETHDEVWEIDPGDPEGATGSLIFTAERMRQGWRAATRAEIRFACLAGSYRVEAELVAREGEHELFRRNWVFEVPRDHI
ncbi:MAG TPA: CocE/NonD family hydrolase [Thermohalobaculum sp.]|nr:CocE/NonD family hydrolase [Thermohalobaculum sp.]